MPLLSDGDVDPTHAATLSSIHRMHELKMLNALFIPGFMLCVTNDTFDPTPPAAVLNPFISML